MNDDTVLLASKQQCSGCGACMKSCPQKAIYFQDDEEGFPTPKIKADECVKCGICNKVCPAIYKPRAHSIHTAYAAQILDKDALRESTSGGMFTVLSREMFRHGGIVYGCVWDENYNAVVQKAENEEEIKPMRGSKYVWSWAGDTFPEIKAYLESGKTVMFTGLPCQVAGLKNYLHKDYERLYLVDFLCSGAPSPLALDRYLDTICKKKNRKDLQLKFRDKNPYGVGVHITYNGKNKRIKKNEHIRNSYYWSFYTRLIDRESCYRCPYSFGERVSDLTLGDYWGISNYHTEFNIREGVSALLINSEKGNRFIQRVKDQIQLSETDPMNIAKRNNLFIGNKVRNIHKPANREQFFQLLKKKGWKAAEHKFLFTKSRILMIVEKTLPSKVSKIFKKIIR